MTDEDLRALVREAIAGVGLAQPAMPIALPPRGHLSHALFTIPSGGDADGPCLIEPVVACNHCGYCRSYGH